MPYSNTKANVAALTLTAADAGAEAYATDTGEIGVYSGSAWVWGKTVTNGNSHDHDGGDGAQIDHTKLGNVGTNTHAQIDAHLASTANPHGTTAAQVGAAPATHAAQHQNSGGDEIATATATANAIPKAGAGGTLAAGWLPAATTDAPGAMELATDAEVAAATAGVVPTAPQLPLFRQATTNALQADTGGNARGVAAMDLQLTRTAASQVASGNYAFIAGGYRNTASGEAAHAEGLTNAASGNYAHAEGYGAAASLLGEHAHAAGMFAAQGGAQYRRFVVRRAVTAHPDTTWYQLFLDGSSARLTLPANALWNFDIKMVGLTNGAPQRWSYDLRGTVVNDGGSVALLESVVTARVESDAAYEARVVGNDTDDALDIEVRRNGGTTYSIRWVAVVEVVQVIY